MSKNETVTCVLIDPSTRRETTERVKPDKDGTVEFKTKQIKVVLDGKMMYNGGERAYIDAARGVQIDYPGLNGWRGIDGKHTWLAARDIRARQVNMATNQDYLKWAKIIMGIFIATMLGNILTIIVLAGKLSG